MYHPEKAHYFQTQLLQVVGQALNAASYTLEDNPVHQSRGLIRFYKPLPDLGEFIHSFVEWQLLTFEQSPAARFRIQLMRNYGQEARAFTDYPDRVEQSLTWVIWHVYGAKLLPSDEHWWSFRYIEDLPYLLAETGKLLFGYGIPWIEKHESTKAL